MHKKPWHIYIICISWTMVWCLSYQYGVPTNELAGAKRAAEPKSAKQKKDICNATAVLKGREIPYTCTKTYTRYASLTAA